MTCVLDTHILIWWWADDDRLPRPLLHHLENTIASGRKVIISDITLWEIAMLVTRGRLHLEAAADTFLQEIESHPALTVSPITGRIALESTRLGPSFPEDPADRIIGATARCHGLPLMTVDERIRDSGVISVV